MRPARAGQLLALGEGLVSGLVKVAALLLLAPLAAQAQTPDALAVKPLAQVWVGYQSIYSPPAPRLDLAVGQFSAVAGAGRWGFGVRARTMGARGEYEYRTPATFRVAELYLATHRNLLAVTGGITAGPSVFVGFAVPLELISGQAPTMPKSCTAMVGIRADGPNWRAELGVGQHQQLQGFAGGGTAHVEMTEHAAWVGDFAVGAHRRFIATIALMLRP